MTFLIIKDAFLSLQKLSHIGGAASPPLVPVASLLNEAGDAKPYIFVFIVLFYK